MPDSPMSRSGDSLYGQLVAEARTLSERSGVPFKRVYDCEMAMFTFHCATGGDLDCECGAHVPQLLDADLHRESYE